MATAVGSRVRFVVAAGELLRSKGFEATRVREVAAAAGAPMGSFYFHFPGGKEELAAAAMRAGGGEFGVFLEQGMDRSGSLPDRVQGLAVSLAEDLRRTRWDRGCPVAATALETLGRSTVLQQTAMEVIDAWVGVLTGRFIDVGLSKAASVELATNVISILEGAELLARIGRDEQPLLRAGRALYAVTAEAMA